MLYFPIAGVFAIIGVAVWGAGNSNLDSIRSCLDLTGALMSILAGIFLILKMVGVSAPSVGSSGGGGQSRGHNKTGAV